MYGDTKKDGTCCLPYSRYCIGLDWTCNISGVCQILKLHALKLVFLPTFKRKTKIKRIWLTSLSKPDKSFRILGTFEHLLVALILFLIIFLHKAEINYEIPFLIVFLLYRKENPLLFKSIFTPQMVGSDTQILASNSLINSRWQRNKCSYYMIRS